MRFVFVFLLSIVQFFCFQQAQAQTSDVKVNPYRSLVINNVQTMNQLNGRFDMGIQLGRVNRWLEATSGHELPAWRVNWTHGRFIANAFEDALREQNQHKDMPQRQKLGGDIWPLRDMSAVFRNWMSSSELSRIDNVAQLRGGPFRLLAVVNRMDAAGDFDDRGNSQATHHPRALGEVHLVYGLVDKEFEQRTGRAFPMTFVVAYRLPALRWLNGRLVRDPRLSQRDLMENPAVWGWRMRSWASLWTELSKHVPGTQSHTNRLAKIISLAAAPENMLHLRSNTQVNRREFELREWYILENTKTLIRRKTRDEPHKCTQNSPQLAKVVENNWSREDNDLDMTTRHPRYFRFRGLNGYSIPGDNLTPILAEFDFFSGCGRTSTTTPFGMQFGGNDVVDGARKVFIAPFARTTRNFVWRLDQVTEEKRHAFAIRTCSGCHGAEGAVNGFHITPRLANQAAKLSPFLTGRGRAYFDHGGTRYRYNELAERRKLLIKYLNREAQPFEGLSRSERSR